MGAMKDFAMDISVKLGYCGVLNEEILELADLILQITENKYNNLPTGELEVIAKNKIKKLMKH